jgi:hypothetical protein
VQQHELNEESCVAGHLPPPISQTEGNTYPFLQQQHSRKKPYLKDTMLNSPSKVRSILSPLNNDPTPISLNKRERRVGKRKNEPYDSSIDRR